MSLLEGQRAPPLGWGRVWGVGAVRQAPSEQRPWTESPPSTPPGSGEWTAFQNPEATCRDLACSPKQCPTPGAPPWGSQLWALGGGPLARFTPLETGPSSALRTAVSPSRLVLCVLGCGGSCPRQLRETPTSPGSSPRTQLEDGEHSSWRRRGEERVQPGVGKTWAVSVPIILPSCGGTPENAWEIRDHTAPIKEAVLSFLRLPSLSVPISCPS